ncbi:MAG: TetR/AcrR family transcriptional regulator [Mediterraneibacter sp.]|nr:TetR/AcrR family transcriptional regulator [Candidatus Mediterraneibacter caccogallinarum]
MQKKVDRRVRKTKSQLRAGLARLMQEKGIGEITVKELVNEVDINRSTFYLHYSDIPALLREIEDDMMEEMERAVREHPIKEDSTSRFIEDIFRVLNENREISRALIGPHGDLGFVRRIEKLLEENSSEFLAQLFPERVQDMKYFYSYCLNGCLGFVKTWLEDGEAKPPEYAADLTFRMVVSSMKAFYETAEDVSDRDAE